MAISPLRENQLARLETPETPALDSPRPALPQVRGFSPLNAFDSPALERTNLLGTTRGEQLRSNAETAALGRLNPEQQAQYTQIAELVQDDPKAASAVRSLLLSGKMTRSDALDGSGNLLDQLSRLADPNTPLQPGVDRAELLGQIARDVQRPFSIDQGKGNFFCGAAAVSTGLAFRNPAEYARLAVGLGAEGSVQLAGTHRRDSETGAFQRGDRITITALPEAISETDRSITQRLLAPALTEYANGENYDTNVDGVNTRTDGKARNAEVNGLFSRQVADMQSAVFGRGYRSYRLETNERRGPEEADTPKEARREDAAQSLVQEQLNNGVQVAIKIEDHWVNVTGFDGQNFTYTDSQGATQSISAAEIFKKADAITYEETAVSEPPPEAGLLPQDGEAADAGESAGGGTRPNTGTVDPGD